MFYCDNIISQSIKFLIILLNNSNKKLVGRNQYYSQRVKTLLLLSEYEFIYAIFLILKAFPKSM